MTMPGPDQLVLAAPALAPRRRAAPGTDVACAEVDELGARAGGVAHVVQRCRALAAFHAIGDGERRAEPGSGRAEAGHPRARNRPHVLGRGSRQLIQMLLARNRMRIRRRHQIRQRTRNGRARRCFTVDCRALEVVTVVELQVAIVASQRQPLRVHRRADQPRILMRTRHHHVEGGLGAMAGLSRHQRFARDALNGGDIGVCEDAREFGCTENALRVRAIDEQLDLSAGLLGEAGGRIGPGAVLGVIQPSSCLDTRSGVSTKIRYLDAEGLRDSPPIGGRIKKLRRGASVDDSNIFASHSHGRDHIARMHTSRSGTAVQNRDATRRLHADPRRQLEELFLRPEGLGRQAQQIPGFTSGKLAGAHVAPPAISTCASNDALVECNPSSA